jgi:hypothetical protein
MLRGNNCIYVVNRSIPIFVLRCQPPQHELLQNPICAVETEIYCEDSRDHLRWRSASFQQK